MRRKLRTVTVLDIPPRTARLLKVIGLAGMVLIVGASLIGNRPETIAVDKIIHFCGYATLAAVFVVALPGRWVVPALIGCIVLGFLIELIQPLNQRTFSLGDMLANTLGVVSGAAIGWGTRLAYRYLKAELSNEHIRRNQIAVQKGTTIVRKGDRIEQAFLVIQGRVALYRTVDGAQVHVADVGPGEMFGLLAEILRIPQYTTAVALTPAKVYRFDVDKLIEDAGGREQPIGAILHALAQDVREARGQLALDAARAGGSPSAERVP